MGFAQPPRGRTAAAPTTGRARRPLWHWLLLGGVGALGLLIVGIVAIIIAVQVITRGDPQTTLEDYYSSLETSDCELFMDSTTESYRKATGVTSCSIFDETIGAVEGIDFQVDGRVNRRGYAIFEVTEHYSDGEREAEATLRFYVRRADGQWDLDGIELVDESSQPII